MANDIEEIKSRLDIVDVISSYIQLQRAGRSYKANCPFHGEKTPSFVVTPDMQIFKCFGCGEGGDVLTFIQKIERVEFGEAIRIAAEKAGYTLTNDSHSDKQSQMKKRLLAANALAAKYWHYLLTEHPQGKDGREYAQKRKLVKKEIDKFQIGYAPPGENLVKFLEKKGYTRSEIIDWGFGVERDGKVMDKFRRRLMLAITNMRGEVVGFSGRYIAQSDKAPKYLNSPETPVYHKGDVLMGLSQALAAARQENFVILQEGNIDILSSHRVGIENILATGGTAITESQCKVIKRLCDTVYFGFDTDSAGIKALIKALEICERVGLKHKAIDIGDYKDPDELISENPDKWKEVVANPSNTIEHLLKILSKDLDMNNPDDKSELVSRMKPVLNALQDKVQLHHFAGMLGTKVGVSETEILDSIRVDARPSYKPHQAESIAVTPVQTQDQRELLLVSILLQFADRVKPEISLEIFHDQDCYNIVKLLLNQKGTIDYNQITDQLPASAIETMQQALSLDLSKVKDLEQEFSRAYKFLYNTFLLSKIAELKIKMKTANLSDEQEKLLLSQLQYFSEERKELVTKS